MGKIAMITGGGRGIGAATSLLAAKAGYDVCVNYVSDHKAADRIVAECQGLGVRAVAVKADVADPDQVRHLFATCDAELGTVSLLVNNAGVIGKATARRPVGRGAETYLRRERLRRDLLRPGGGQTHGPIGG